MRFHSLKHVQVSVKKVALLEKINTKESLREAETELLRLAEKKPNSNFVPDYIENMLVFAYLGDFYDRRGDRKKALEFYTKAGNYEGKTTTEYAIRARVYKKLEDYSQKSNWTNYSKALSLIIQAEKLIPGFLRDEPEKEYARYSKNGNLTLEFYTDKAEILEAWSNLKGITDAERLKSEAREAREKIKEIKTKKEKSLCK